MAKLSLADLRKLREDKKPAMELRDYLNKTGSITIAMGTVGIASGAKKTLAAFSDLLIAEKVSHLALMQGPNRGTEGFDPMVEIHLPGEEPIVYQRVDADRAKQIFEKHIKNKTVIKDFVYQKPGA